MTLSAASIVGQVDNQVSVDLNGETAILNLASMSYFGLDEVGRFIWEAISEPKAVDQICAAVCKHFDVSEEQCRIDVLSFLLELDKAGLIEI